MKMEGATQNPTCEKKAPKPSTTRNTATWGVRGEHYEEATLGNFQPTRFRTSAPRAAITHTHTHTHTHTPKDIIRTQKINLLGKKFKKF